MAKVALSADNIHFILNYCAFEASNSIKVYSHNKDSDIASAKLNNLTTEQQGKSIVTCLKKKSSPDYDFLLKGSQILIRFPIDFKNKEKSFVTIENAIQTTDEVHARGSCSVNDVSVIVNLNEENHNTICKGGMWNFTLKKGVKKKFSFIHVKHRSVDKGLSQSFTNLD